MILKRNEKNVMISLSVNSPKSPDKMRQHLVVQLIFHEALKINNIYTHKKKTKTKKQQFYTNYQIKLFNPVLLSKYS